MTEDDIAWAEMRHLGRRVQVRPMPQRHSRWALMVAKGWVNPREALETALLKFGLDHPIRRPNLFRTPLADGEPLIYYVR